MTDQAAPAAIPEFPSQDINKNSLSNAERLRSHLKPDSLAAALLGAWGEGDTPQSRRERLLAALQAFSAKGDGEDAPPAK